MSDDMWGASDGGWSACGMPHHMMRHRMWDGKCMHRRRHHHVHHHRHHHHHYHEHHVFHHRAWE